MYVDNIDVDQQETIINNRNQKIKALKKELLLREASLRNAKSQLKFLRSDNERLLKERPATIYRTVDQIKKIERENREWIEMYKENDKTIKELQDRLREKGNA